MYRDSRSATVAICGETNDFQAAEQAMNHQDEAVQILFSISFVTLQSVFYAKLQRVWNSFRIWPGAAWKDNYRHMITFTRCN